MSVSLAHTIEELARLATWRNGLDILLVAIVIYNLLLLIRGTRAVQALVGILFLGLVYYVARTLDLKALEETLESVFTWLPFAIIVLFQAEIRRALASFGRTPLFGARTQHEVIGHLNAVVLAATTLAERKVGALIVIERLEGLREYVENGILLDAEISLDLLINLFTPDTPTHDGAVIIQGNRIAAATCFLPLTQDPELSKEFGTRHRAALGITEETDALVVVVSEETGIISVAYGGDMLRNLDSKDLRNILIKNLVSDLSPERPRLI